VTSAQWWIDNRVSDWLRHHHTVWPQIAARHSARTSCPAHDNTAANVLGPTNSKDLMLIIIIIIIIIVINNVLIKVTLSCQRYWHRTKLDKTTQTKRQNRRQSVVAGRQQLYCAVQSQSPVIVKRRTTNYSLQLAYISYQKLLVALCQWHVMSTFCTAFYSSDDILVDFRSDAGELLIIRSCG